MNQLEWGSDLRGIPLPIADAMESLFNSTFDHNGPKPPLPFATEADVQGLLTMLFTCWLSGGNPPLFMDFRKVWEPWEIQELGAEAGRSRSRGEELWARQGIVDGDNSGSASFDWAGRPGDPVEKIMANVSMPGADESLLPRRRQQRHVHHARRHRLHRRPAGLQRAVRHVQPGLGRGGHGRSARASWPRRWPTRRTSPGRTPGSCPSTPRWPSTSSMPRPTISTRLGTWRRPGCNTGWTWPTCCRSRPGRGARSGWKGSIGRCPCLHLLNGGEAHAKLLRAGGR